MKKLVILGASGSVGKQCLDICLHNEDLFDIVGLSVGENVQVLTDYLNNHDLPYACVKFKEDKEILTKTYPKTVFYYGEEGLMMMASLSDVDVVVNSLQGAVGLMPTMAAITHHHDIALANKETLVAAGDIVMAKAKEYGVNIIPVDSEHSAIFQTLMGYRHSDINRLIITASGGSFRNLSREELKNVDVEHALKHPKWNMGAKITIDSASMMNKGFEVIEAHHLFNMPYDKIDVVLHPQSIVHSMTEFKDHCVLAQLAVTDMRLPIQFALTYPERVENTYETLDLVKLGSLTFEKMDTQRFPLLKVAYECGEKGGNMPAMMNAANEVAVHLFLEKKISFLDIEKIVMKVCQYGEERFIPQPNLEEILQANAWATDMAYRIANEG